MRELVKRYSDVQLATLVDSPPPGPAWVHEVKLDGYRLLGFLEAKAVKLVTRNGNDWTARFPSIATSLSRLAATSAVLDMEAVMMDSSGRSSFQALQNALGDGGDAASVTAYVFDLLHFNGKDLTARPLIERKKALQALLKRSKAAKALKFSRHLAVDGTAMLAESCSLGLEGIVSKLAESPYRKGRQKSWLKSKCINRQEFIILGYSGPKSGDRALGALYLGYLKEGALTYAGKVGTGFTHQSARDILARLRPLRTSRPAGSPALPGREMREIEWVKPRLLCEVAFVEWTQDGRIRHASFQGLREDKPARAVRREIPRHLDEVAPVRTRRGRSASRAGAPGDESLVLEGVRISHAERVIDPKSGATKGDVARYYAAASRHVLQSIATHPLTVIRCPEGIDGERFYQRNPGRGLGPDVVAFTWHYAEKNKEYDYFYIRRAAGLLELVQMNALEFHPWGTRYTRMDHPDRMIFDLDPDVDVPFEAVKRAARDLKRRLDGFGLQSFLKCTGGKGLHIVVPLSEKDRWPDVKAWCGALAHRMADEAPDLYVATMTKAKRRGKVFIDYFRNDYTATAVGDFSVRARPGLPVAVPLEWNELRALRSAAQFSMPDALARLKRKPLDDGRYSIRQRIPKRAAAARGVGRPPT